MKKICVILFLFLFQQNLFSQSKEDKPNIVYILADDMGYGDVSAYNPDARIKTVNIDNLAKEGMRFTAAHASSSVCTPSRYSILTGRYNWRSRLKSGVLGGLDEPLIAASRMTIADVLKNNGYNTACIGKWHLGLSFTLSDQKRARFNTKTGQTNIEFNKALSQSPNDLGFDYFYGVAASADMAPYMFIENRNFVGRYDTIKGDPRYTKSDMSQFFRAGPASKSFTPQSILPRITEKAQAFIRKQSKDKPFFLYFPLTAPHKPIAPDSAFMGKSKLHAYLDFCLQVDNTVGEIVKTLKEKGLYGNTIIVFTSDNGFAPYVDVKFLESHGHYPSYIYRGYKADAWEGGHRVPFIVQWPGKIAPRTVTNEVVSLADWLATEAAITHTKIPENAAEDSYSLLPVLLGKEYHHPLREATVFHSMSGMFAIQKGKWELIMCNEKKAGGNWVADKRYDTANYQTDTPFQLFNLQTDPGETNNLYDKYPQKVQALKILLAQYIKDGRSTKGSPQKNNDAVRWPQIDWMANL